MMKKKFIAGAVSALLLAVAIGTVFTGSAAPGDSSDPLITLSYLEKIAVPEMTEQITANVEKSLTELIDARIQEALKNTVQPTAAPAETPAPTPTHTPSIFDPINPTSVPNENELTPSPSASPDATAQPDPTEEPQPPVSVSYKVLELHKGDIFYGSEGTEIIFRAGDAFAFTPYENQGLSDITGSVEAINGTKLIKNHLYICPRDDGRGFNVESGLCYILVRGGYRLG